jgi:hypothetical protein
MKHSVCAWLAFASIVPACSGDDGPPGDVDAPTGTPDAPPTGGREELDLSVGGPAPLDVLLVIDNSGSMIPYQDQLGAAIHLLTDALGTGPDLPDLHLGVVTSDLGSLGVFTGDPACSSSDQGQLRTGNCAGIPFDESFLTDAPDPGGGRIKNYAGTLAAAARCMVSVGNQGCGFEQHLEAMRLALGQPGFVRAEADLAVLVLGDEDDCSAYNPDFFGPESPQLGPLDSFRCFEFGVECTPDDPRAVGVKSGCVSREDSPHLHPMTRYIDFLRDLKPAPTQITVGLITGNIEPVEVGRRTPPGSTVPRPDLLPSCSFMSADGTRLTADPGVRLRQFIDGFPGRNTASTICEENYTGLTELGTLAHRASHGNACFAGTAIDTVPGGGIDADCDVELTEPGSAPVDVPACDAGMTNRPCYHVVVSTDCAAGAHHQLVIETQGTPPAGTRAHASCRVE